jgi:predicted nucleic acid-binding protein
MMKLLLDTNIVSEVCHPRDDRRVQRWLARMSERATVYLSGVVDYELRRELLRSGSTRALAKLDRLAESLPYLPMTKDMWRCAAVLWSEQMQRGAVPAKGISGDTLLIAQARVASAFVVTTNHRHFDDFILAMDWTDLPIG